MINIPTIYFHYILITISSILAIKIVFKTNLIQIFVKSWQSFTERFQLYQLYKVPQYNNPHFQENHLYRQVSTYLNSLILSSNDTDLTNLLSGSNSNDVVFKLDSGQSLNDTFLGAKLRWTNRAEETTQSSSSFLLLRIKRSDKKRIFRQYFQHILTVADEIDQRNKEIKLHVAAAGDRRWRSVPFTHPASFDSVMVEADLKNKVKSDLELFLKSKQYYRRLGRAWNRSYLLYGGGGASAAGRTSFIAAMAKLLSYDIYDLDVARVSDSSDLKALLLQTSPRSVIVVEEIDRISPRLSEGIFSWLGEERVLVLTTNGHDKERAFGFDPTAAMRPGLVDVHVHFPLCDNFSSFKSLASSYLGLKEHKLFPQVEEIFKSGGGSGFLSPDEIGEIMMSNRTSPTRALKSVISALNHSSVGGLGSGSGSGRSGDELGEPGGSVFSRESTIQTVKEFRKLYGLLKMGSRRKEEPIVDLDGSRHY